MSSVSVLRYSLEATLEPHAYAISNHLHCLVSGHPSTKTRVVCWDNSYHQVLATVSASLETASARSLVVCTPSRCDVGTRKFGDTLVPTPENYILMEISCRNYCVLIFSCGNPTALPTLRAQMNGFGKGLGYSSYADGRTDEKATGADGLKATDVSGCNFREYGVL